MSCPVCREDHQKGTTVGFSSMNKECTDKWNGMSVEERRKVMSQRQTEEEMKDTIERLKEARYFLRALKIQILDSPDIEKQKQTILEFGALVPLTMVAKGTPPEVAQAFGRKIKTKRERQAERIRLAMKTLDEIIDENESAEQVPMSEL